MINANKISIDESEENVDLSDLHISCDATDCDSIAARLMVVIKEAVAEWQTNPTGDIRFREALIGRTYIGPHPAR